MKRILLVTSGQPSANPRLVKEALFFVQKGYNVSVIYCPISSWADRFDRELIDKNSNIRWIRVGIAQTESKLIFWLYRLRKRLWSIIFIYFGDILDASIKSSVLFSQELRKEALKHHADIYIGHNLGAIKAVVDASKKYNSRRYFDFEDFHRGEEIKNSFHWKLVEKIENKYIPELKGAWAASPLISDAYNLLFPRLNVFTINNCFTLDYANKSLRKLDDSKLELFWFSQYIGKNRGLEQIILSIGRLNNEFITLTILGNTNLEIKRYFEKLSKENGLKPQQIIFLNPVSDREIVQIASNYHIGVASEVPHVLNRELCLTNKIFIYLLAGNAILFSNTPSQEKFATENPKIGLVYTNNDIECSANRINEFFENRKLLNAYRLNSLNLAKELNWEEEGTKLIAFLTRL